MAEIKGRLLAIRVLWGTTYLTLSTIYAPNERQEPFLKQAVAEVLTSPDAAVVVGGDINLVMDPDFDRSNPRSQQTGALSQEGKGWLLECGLTDVWRHLHPTERDYTFYSAAHKSYARLDHFFASAPLLPSIQAADIHPRSLSDHMLLFITLNEWHTNLSRPGWRLRESLLHSDDNIQRIHTTIQHYLLENDTGTTALVSVWEALKLVARGEFINLTAAYSTLRREKRAELEKEVGELEAVHKRTGAPRVWRALESRRRLLKHLDLDRAEHTLLRLRHKFYLSGDKCGKMLAHKLRTTTQKFSVQAISETAGEEHNTDDKIALTFKDFYHHLYTASDTLDQNQQIYLHSCDIVPLPPMTVEALDADIRIEEVISAISRLKLAKSPGPDGFPASFYKTFCTELAPFLTQLFNSFLETGILTPSMNEAAISVILKPGKDPKLCGSYHPLSLLNVDAKLFSSTLASRLSPLMEGIIDPDQSGFIPTRQGGDNAKRLLHLIDVVHRARREACLLSIDAEKAFDRVEWSYLFETLRAYGFGINFLCWIQCLYSDPKAFVKVNGLKSPLFPIAHGTRQGCPLSPLLFALYLEPFAQRVRAQSEIVGIKFGAGSHKISLYADDIILSITQPRQSLHALLHELSEFGSVSGFKVNLAKSQILNLSIPPDEVADLAQDFAFTWTSTEMTYLGIIGSYASANTSAQLCSIKHAND